MGKQNKKILKQTLSYCPASYNDCKAVRGLIFSISRALVVTGDLWLLLISAIFFLFSNLYSTCLIIRITNKMVQRTSNSMSIKILSMYILHTSLLYKSCNDVFEVGMWKWIWLFKRFLFLSSTLFEVLIHNDYISKTCWDN